MNAFYWDTSALLKLYIYENDSLDFTKFAERSEGPAWTSAITEVELLCALHRKEREGDISDIDLSSALGRFSKDRTDGRIAQKPCDDEIALEARKIVELARARRRPVMIRSLDAIQVASALSVKADGIVTTDTRMRQAATIVKLRVIPEN